MKCTKNVYRSELTDEHLKSLLIIGTSKISPQLQTIVCIHDIHRFPIHKISIEVVKEWSKRFRMGQEFLEDDERPGRPVEVITEDKVALVDVLVLSNRCLKVKEIAEMANLSDTTVRRILHDRLSMQKVSAGWVPKHLSAVQKQRRARLSFSAPKILDSFLAKRVDFD
nr:unnamed protein product [Callosobruchus analis]